MKQFKQKKYIKGTKKGFQKSQNHIYPENKTKDVIIEETLEQRLNRVIDKYKAISELVVGFTPYTFDFALEKFEGTTNKPAKISAFEKAIVGIINIDSQASFLSIGNIMGLDVEHDLAEKQMLRNAIDTMIRYELIAGDESAYFITDQGRDFAAHGERMSSFNSSFDLLYLPFNHSFLQMRNCISSIEDATVISEDEIKAVDFVKNPLTFEEIVQLSEVQASNMQNAKERYLLQSASHVSTTYYNYQYTICFLQSIRTQEIRTLVYDDNQQCIIPHLSVLIDNTPDLKQTIFNLMLKSASENEELSIYDNLELASAEVDKEDFAKINEAVQKLIAQEDESAEDQSGEPKQHIDSADLSERLHKRALYDSITFEAEIHNIFQNDRPDEIWLSSPWVSDGTFMKNRLPLIKNFLNRGGKVFVSYSAPDGGLDSHKDKMVGDKSKVSLSELSSEYPKQFYHVELPAFHKKNVIEVKNGQCVLFTGSFNVLSFSVTSKNITHVRAEEMCLAHYQAAINQYSETKRQFAQVYIESAIDSINEMSTEDLIKYENPKLSYFRADDSLADLFIDFDNALEERKTEIEQDILLSKLTVLKNDIETALENKMTSKDVQRYRVRLFKLSKLYEENAMDQSHINEIHKLHNLIDKAILVDTINDNPVEEKPESVQPENKLSTVLSSAVSCYNIEPEDTETLFKKIISIYYLSLFGNAKKSGVNEKWQIELINTLKNSFWESVLSYSLANDMKNQGMKRLFVVINGYFFTFYGVDVDKASLTALYKKKKYIDKASCKDAFKTLNEELINYLK